MYYTTDGTTPTSGSTPYTIPIVITSTTTLKVIAEATGYINSAVATGVYVKSSGGGGSASGSKSFRTEDFGASITSPNTSVMGTNTRTKIVG